MADKSDIEWTDATWNPITGCSVVSPGCTNCYAMKLAGTRLQHHPSRAGLTTMSKAGPVWNGQVRLNDEWLLQPLHWKAPRRIFVCAHGDLFHESVPDEWIDRVFAVMALAPQHTFQVLTKRSKRMRKYLATSGAVDKVVDAIREIGLAAELRSRANPSTRRMITQDQIIDTDARATAFNLEGGYSEWPLPNVWLGVSTEDQQRADERIPDLLATPAAVRFISAEPLLGALDISTPFHSGRPYLGLPIHQNPHDQTWHQYGRSGSHLDWVIVGGESGSGARRMHPDWVRSLRDQCAAAGVPFFFKQWGEWAPYDRSAYASSKLASPNSLDNPMQRFGKARAGRLLDGVERNGMPEVRRG